MFESDGKMGEAELKLAQVEIDEIVAEELSNLIELLPSDGSVVQHFAPLGSSQWIYRFHFKSLLAEFNALGFGLRPKEAFAAAQKTLLKQIQEWHDLRDSNISYVGKDHSALLWQLAATAKQDRTEGNGTSHKPTVLIVEDDVDIAAATAAAFEKCGCKTIISDGQDKSVHPMSFQDVDFIVLDWMLGADLSADKLVKRSVGAIDAFKDLRLRFKRQPGKIVTYSVLDRSKISVPESQYFKYLDHWQKPVKPRDLATKVSELLSTNGY